MPLNKDTSAIEIWLSQIDLQQYAQAFIDNDIDESLLGDLDHDLLKEIGVTSIGHRIKILRACQATVDANPHPAPLRSSEEVAPPSNALQSPESVPNKTDGAVHADSVSALHASADNAERKHITLMFCDMVGSTRLSTLYDPEDYTVIIQSYHATCVALINRYGGYVARFMGDGVLAYFGYPQSYENNAERSINAGLEIIQAISALEPQPGLKLQSRVGIATGLVVIGEKVAGAASESVASGDTPNLAARLQSLAEPDQLVVADSTRRLCGDLFEWEALGKHKLKGFDAPIPAFSVTIGNTVESRFNATRHATRSGIVGRDLEVALLHERWHSAFSGEGQMVLVTGEAGMGKSRLVYETLKQITQKQFEQVNLQCSPYHTDSAFHPIVDYFNRQSGLLPKDDEATRHGKLTATLHAGRDLADADLSLLLGALAFHSDHAIDKTLQTSAEQRKQRTLDLLVGWFTNLSTSQPLLMVIEDIHWMDPTTQAFLQQMLDVLEDAPVLIIATARPSYTYDFAGHTAVSQLALNRLNRAQMIEIISLVTDGKALPADVTRDILDKADGIPLYVEELTRYVLESGQLQERDTSYELIGQVTQINIPATLYDSLSARLDRLGNAKEIAQVGAVIGREFNVGLLQAVLDISEEDLLGSLMILMNIGLLARKSNDSGTNFLFKHALMRDAAYQGLLYSRRRHWHRRIATTISELFPTIAQTQPEMLAQHYTDADMIEPALRQWNVCAATSLEKFNNIEAAVQAGHGLALLAKQSNKSEFALLEVDLQLATAYALRATEGYSAPGSEAAYKRAFDLASELQLTSAMSASATGLCSAYHVGGQMQKAYSIAVQLGKNGESAELQENASFLEGQVLYSLGNQAQSLAKFSETLAAKEERTRRGEGPSLRDKLFDSRCAAWQYMQRNKLLLGFPDQADDLCERATSRATELAQPTAMCATLIGYCLQLQRTGRDMSEPARRLEAITDQHQISYWRAWASYCNGAAAFYHGGYIEAARLINKSIDAHDAMNSLMGMATILGTLGEVLQKQKQFDNALQAYDRAIGVIEQTEERCDEAELHRLRGECLLEQSAALNTAGAAAAFEKSLQIARTQKTLWWELLSATSYAKLLLTLEKPEEALRQLQPSFESITEGQGLKPVEDARLVMNQCRLLPGQVQPENITQ